MKFFQTYQQGGPFSTAYPQRGNWKTLKQMYTFKAELGWVEKCLHDFLITQGPYPADQVTEEAIKYIHSY